MLMSAQVGVTQTSSPNAVYFKDHILRSPFFNFSFQVPETLSQNTGEIEKQMMKNGAFLTTNSVTVLFSAFDFSSNGHRGVVIAAYKTDQRTAQAYADILARNMKARNWTSQERPQQLVIAGREFYRVDIQRDHHYGASFSTAVNGYVLDFVLNGTTQEDIQALSESLGTMRFTIPPKP